MSNSNCKDFNKKCHDFRDCTDCDDDLSCIRVPKPNGGQEKRCKLFNPNELAHSDPHAR
jgi:hypothetical protein